VFLLLKPSRPWRIALRVESTPMEIRG